MPDNHCYPMWYNGHGIDIGKLHKGHWMYVKPDWYYGCGEFGAEGLDFVEVMKEYDDPQGYYTYQLRGSWEAYKCFLGRPFVRSLSHDEE